MLVSSIVVILAYAFYLLPDIRDSLILKGSYLTARVVIFVSGSKIEVYGKKNIPKGSGILFVANHQSMFDIPSMVVSIPKIVGYIAKRELYRYPPLNFWLMLFGSIPINRASLKESVIVIKKGIKKLERGKNILIFPEGTRSKSNKMRSFKGGSFRLAKARGASIVPVTIVNSHKVLKIRKNTIKVFIHKQISLDKMDKHQLSKLPHRVQNIIQTKLKKA